MDGANMIVLLGLARSIHQQDGSKLHPTRRHGDTATLAGAFTICVQRRWSSLGFNQSHPMVSAADGYLGKRGA